MWLSVPNTLNKRAPYSGRLTGASKLESALRERTESQQKLLSKYLNDDPNIVGIFDKMNSRFNEGIATLKDQIAEAKTEKATFEDLLAFSKSLLVDIPTAWERADIDQKQRVQNILFPDALKYHPEKGILNSARNLFSASWRISWAEKC